MAKGEVRRERIRRGTTSLTKKRRMELANRVVDFYQEDTEARTAERSVRLQRYAKYRQWTSGKTFPWENSSDQSVPDLTEASLRTQDTLHNAVMSGRPEVVVARALLEKDEEKVDLINSLSDTQFFVEQNGEKVIEEMAEEFTNEPSCSVFVSWVKEERNARVIRSFDPIPDEIEPRVYFRQLILQEWADNFFVPLDDEGWEWSVEHDKEDKEDTKVSFYTLPSGEVEMVLDEIQTVFDGPRAFVKSYEDVITPPRVSNLQIPGPSNPGGASHVILVDYPTVDEIRRLKESGRYDLIPDDHMERLVNINSRRWDEEQEKRQKDTMQGVNEDRPQPRDKRHKVITRLTCFDIVNLKEDGPLEDVVFWVLLETKTLLRATRLSEEYPFKTPRRPLAEGTYLPVKGRRSGISLLELMEGLHDWMKETIDQAVDAGTLTNTPFWFYRASSSVKPETIRLGPGDGMPLNDPQNDINFPNLPNAGQAFGFNMLTVIQQIRERLSLLGDIQAGRVPQGKSSALRTVGGLQTLLSQGEARPERVLRRFFMMLTDVFRMYHELNVRFLPDGKEFRVSGFVQPRENPYRKVSNSREIEGSYSFDFQANVQNASRQSKQQALEQLLSIAASPLSFQTGIMQPDGLYNILVDSTRSLGQDPNRYFTPPTPEVFRKSIMAEDAIDMILDSQVPIGKPLEGPELHLEKLQAFIEMDEFGLLSKEQVELFRQYTQQVAALGQQMQQRLAEQAAAQQAQQQRPGTIGGNGAAPPGSAQPPLQNNELADEQLPSAGGGGQAR